MGAVKKALDVVQFMVRNTTLSACICQDVKPIALYGLATNPAPAGGAPNCFALPGVIVSRSGRRFLVSTMGAAVGWVDAGSVVGWGTASSAVRPSMKLTILEASLAALKISRRSAFKALIHDPT